MRRGLLVTIQLIAAAVAITATAAFRLGDMMAPASRLRDAMSLASLGAILVFTVLGVWAARGAGGRPRLGVFALALALTLMSPFAEPVSGTAIRMSAERARAAEGARIETSLAAKLDAYAADVDARIATQRPYTPAEAVRLIDVVAGSDLSNYGLADRSREAFALLIRALDARLIDPNGLVQGPRPVDVKPVPLFVFYYQFNIQPVRLRDVGEPHWRLLALLVDHGADLAAAGAERIAADLAQARSQAAPTR